MQQTCFSWEVTIYCRLEECNVCCSPFGKIDSHLHPFIHPVPSHSAAESIVQSFTHSFHSCFLSSMYPPIHPFIHPFNSHSFPPPLPHESSMSQGRRSQSPILHPSFRPFPSRIIHESNAALKSSQLASISSTCSRRDHSISQTFFPHGSFMSQKRRSNPLDLHQFPDFSPSESFIRSKAAL